MQLIYYNYITKRDNETYLNRLKAAVHRMKEIFTNIENLNYSYPSTTWVEIYIAIRAM